MVRKANSPYRMKVTPSMKIDSISLENYRNIEHAELEFSDGVNVIEGLNAQGKTNMLEAVYYMSLGRSFRRAPDIELIRRGESRARAAVKFTDSVRSQTLELEFFSDRGRATRHVRHNRVPVRRMSEMIGAFRSVLFCPDHLSIVKDGPAVRRNWIDVALSQLDSSYMYELKKYYKILAERNTLIKSCRQGGADRTFRDTIGMWSEQLAESGAELTLRRVAYLDRISKYVDGFFSEMTRDAGGNSTERIGLSYASSSFSKAGARSSDADEDGACAEIDAAESKNAVRESLYRLLMSRHDREIAVGSTLFGIHKDDIKIKINGSAARNFASQGQQRSIALALKLAEGELSAEYTGESPVFLLDDMLSELDTRRREYILNELSGRQVIITTCEGIESLSGVGNVRRIAAESGRFSVM